MIGPSRSRPFAAASYLTAAVLLCPWILYCDRGPPPADPSTTRSAAARLSPGDAVEQRLSGGMGHLYLIALQPGDFLHIVVEQRGIDVIVSLFSPQGERLVEVDSPNGSQGPEPLLAVADDAGDYRVEVRSWGAETAPGTYQVRFEELREATAEDRTRAASERLFERAYRLRRNPQAEALRQAADGFAEALEGFRAIGDRRRQAEALYFLAWTASDLGEHTRALDAYRGALELFHALGDRDREADTLNDLGLIHRRLGDLELAQDHYQRALRLRHETGDLRGEAVTLNNLGRIRSLRGEKQAALDLFTRALDHWREAGDGLQEAFALTNLGEVYASLGMYEEALDHHQRALHLRRRAGDRRGEAVTLTRIASVALRSGDIRQALEPLDLALGLRRELGDLRGEAVTLGFLADAHTALGEMDEARRLYDQALAIHRRSGDAANTALVLNNLGWLLARSEQPERALPRFEEALATDPGSADRSLEAAIRFGIAWAQRSQGRPREALASIEAALELIETHRSDAASLAMRSAYFASKQHYHQFHIDLLMELDRGEPGRGWDESALEATERARARSLLDALAEVGAEIRRGVAPELLSRERDLQRRINAAARQQPGAWGNGSGGQMRELLLTYEHLRAEIRLASPRYATLAAPRPLAAREIQGLLDPDTALLVYALGEARSFLWVVTDSDLSSFELPPREEIEEAARRAHQLLTSSHLRQARAGTERALGELAARVLQPAAGRLGKPRLVVVAEGALQLIPFAALPEPSPDGGSSGAPQPLLLSHEIVRLPSASVLRALRQETASRPPAPRGILVLADPVLSAQDPRVAARVAPEAPAAAVVGGPWQPLAFSRREAERILAPLPSGQGRLALGFEASRETALGGELGRYRILHFATHAVPDPRHPDLSGIVLSMVDEEGRPRDGFLRLHEISNLELAADLVVLSSCESALGRDLRGEGLVGLAQGFLHAGAARVVVSLWKVSDRATAELMARFYHHGIEQGLTPAAALRQAQLSLWREPAWHAPYFWAGFVLVGEWR